MVEKTIERICDQCGISFRVIPSRLKHGRGKHCSPKCQYATRRAQPKRAIKFSCIGCDKELTRYPSVVQQHRGSGKYCTRECRDIHWIGKNNPNWQNGDGVYKRGPRWHAIRRRVVARDKSACVKCGAKGQIHVHHKVPFRMFVDAAKANALSNLISLCPPCHRREDAKHKWVRLPESGSVLKFSATGAAWQLAKERGLV